jgi:GNAT superfamily N-acetyltransferase
MVSYHFLCICYKSEFFMPEIRLARVEESSLITTLGLRSKAHWGYSQEFMDACRHQFVLADEVILAGNVFVLEEGGIIQGYSTLEHHDEQTALLGDLFIEPSAIGKGYGAKLWQHIKAEAMKRGYTRLLVESDPNALAFYEKMGMKICGEKKSTLFEGRVLPLLDMNL